MPTPRAEVIARPMAGAQVVIVKLLASRTVSAVARLADVERVFLPAGQQIEQAPAAEGIAEGAGELPTARLVYYVGRKCKCSSTASRKLTSRYYRSATC